jgi:hypothetical protein
MLVLMKGGERESELSIRFHGVCVVRKLIIRRNDYNDLAFRDKRR